MMKLSAYRLFVPIGLAMLALATLLMPVSAQQGHNPVAPDSPEASPIASPVASGAGWTIGEITPLEIDGVPVSISPDGQWLVGIKGRVEVCLWQVSDFAETCAGEVRGVDPDSFAWAPDSSAVAFSTQAFLLFIDSDIQVIDVATGTLTNLTDDGLDDRLGLDRESVDPAVTVDVMPAWTTDSKEIVYSQNPWNHPGDSIPTNIARVSRDGGTPEVLTALDGYPMSIFTPMRVLSDGSVLYTVGFADVDDQVNGIWQLTPDGKTTQLIEGHSDSDYPLPLISSVWEGDGEFAITGFSLMKMNEGTRNLETPFAFIWSSADGEILPMEATTAEESAWVYGSAIAPDGQTVVKTVSIAGNGFAVEVVGPAGSSSESLPELEGEGAGGTRSRYVLPVMAANGTVFVPAMGTAAPVLVTLVPA